MQIKIAINGFGRIGRATFRKLIGHASIRVVAINDLAATDNLAHLLKYDSVHGMCSHAIEYEGDTLVAGSVRVPVYHEAEPARLPWKHLDVDVVIESTGRFVTPALASQHIVAGAKKVIISAPAQQDDNEEVPFVVLGVNDHIIDKSLQIFSNASCTTNNVAPLIKVLDDNWGIEKAFITTVHSYTLDQNILDAPHKDFRRGRTAAQNIVPTTTGAAKAVTRLFPHLGNNIGGAGIRVPVPDGSLTDLTCTLERTTSAEDINAAFRAAAQGHMKGVLQYTTDSIVSRDVLGNTHSAVFDAQLTTVLGDKNKLVKVIAWYDNEWGYSSRLIELVERIV